MNLSRILGTAKYTAGKSFNDLLPKRKLRPGETIGTAKVISDTWVRNETRVEQAKASGLAWAKVVEAGQLEIVLHCSVPPRPLWPNGHSALSPIRKNELFQAHKMAVVAALNEVVPATPLVPWHKTLLTPTFFFGTRRKRDYDGAAASLKAYQDGLTAAGLIVDDDSEHLARREPAFGEDKANPRVELIITYCGS
jgi:hypothetical protein